MEAHKNKSIFLVDRYIYCAIPTPDLEFLLESQGIFNYNADLEGFKHSVCTNRDSLPNSGEYEKAGGVSYNLSEIFSPNIVGEHFNPYKRFQSCLSVASRTCSKVLDLAGLEIRDISAVEPHENVFLDIVCTFPFEIDILLVNAKYRSRAPYKVSKNGKKTSQLDIKPHHLIDRMNRCRKAFFDRINEVFTYRDSSKTLGCSSSLHLWSSSVPFLPNSHVHNIIPFFSYNKEIRRFPIEILEQDLIDSVCWVECGSKKVASKREYGNLGNVVTHNEEKPLKRRFVVDEGRYKQLRLRISNLLRDSLGFEGCVWHDQRFPVDVDLIKQIWSDCVRSEFNDILPATGMKGYRGSYQPVFDVHVNFIPWMQKSRLLHALQYKSRPPVLDLDLFFRKISKNSNNWNFVKDYNSLNFELLEDFLNYQLQVAINCSNTPDINRYEAQLKKLSQLQQSYSEKDFYEWLQFLSVWVTDTRVYGFWRNIKHYMLDPEHEILVEQIVCPICNGSIESLRIVDFCVVNSVIVRNRSNFCIYSLDGG